MSLFLRTFSLGPCISAQGAPRGSQDRWADLPTHAGGDPDPHAVLRLGRGRVVERVQRLARGLVAEPRGGRAYSPGLMAGAKELRYDCTAGRNVIEKNGDTKACVRTSASCTMRHAPGRDFCWHAGGGGDGSALCVTVIMKRLRSWQAELGTWDARRKSVGQVF